MWRTVGFLVFSIACASAAQQRIFEFHNGFWLNLHQFLCHEAQSDASPSGPAEWREAVAYYRREIIPRDPLKPEMAALNNRLSEAGSAAALPAEGLDPALVALLAAAAPEYRRTTWSQHERANSAWIEAVKPLLEKFGQSIRDDIARAYAIEWPNAPIRTDVAAYAGDRGAYTTVSPAHITISSLDPTYRGDAALEMLFHESSHTVDDKLQQALNDELDARHLLFRRRGFEHAIIFFTAGEMTRRYIPGYQPYGIRNGVLDRGWPGSLPVLEKDWKPYLEHRTDFATAIRAVVEDYGVSK